MTDKQEQVYLWIVFMVMFIALFMWAFQSRLL